MVERLQNSDAQPRTDRAPGAEAGSRREQIIVLGSDGSGLSRVSQILTAGVTDARPTAVVPVQYLNDLDDAFRGEPGKQRPSTIGLVLLPEVRLEDESGARRTLITDDPSSERTVGRFVDHMCARREIPLVRLGYDVMPQEVGRAVATLLNPPTPRSR